MSGCNHTETYEEWVENIDSGDWRKTGGGHWNSYEVSTIVEFLGNWRCTKCGWSFASEDNFEDR